MFFVEIFSLKGRPVEKEGNNKIGGCASLEREVIYLSEINRIYDGVEAETRKSQASF